MTPQPMSTTWSVTPLHWTRLAGDHAIAAINGLVTNDVTRLADDHGHFAVALTPKGKVLADCRILRCSPTELLIGVSTEAAPGWWDMLRKYVNPRLARYTDETTATATFLVAGADAASVLGAPGDAVDAWPPWRHAAVRLHDVDVRVVRTPILGDVPAFLVIAPADRASDVTRQLTAAGTSETPADALEPLRIEAGWPAWGRDMDDGTIPQEANLDTLGAISFDKGCYTGQETVARVHFRGHVNRHLRGLVADGPLVRGASLSDDRGKLVGDVRSVAVSARFGPIALAMVRREVPVGGEVVVDGGTRARVVALPFETRDTG